MQPDHPTPSGSALTRDDALRTRDGGHLDIAPANVYFCPQRQAFFDMATDVPKSAEFAARWSHVRHEFPQAPRKPRTAA
jgi:hypothetical protein